MRSIRSSKWELWQRQFVTSAIFNSACCNLVHAGKLNRTEFNFHFPQIRFKSDQSKFIPTSHTHTQTYPPISHIHTHSTIRSGGGDPLYNKRGNFFLIWKCTSTTPAAIVHGGNVNSRAPLPPAVKQFDAYNVRKSLQAKSTHASTNWGHLKWRLGASRWSFFWLLPLRLSSCL